MRTPSALLAAVLLATAAGCTLHPEDTPLEPDSPVHLSDAQHRIVAAGRDVIDHAVGPGTVLADLDGNGNPLTVTCSRFSKAPPDSPVSSGYSYRVQEGDPARVPTYLARFAAYLRARGWTRKEGLPRGHIGFEHDSYSMSMSWAPSTGLLAFGYDTGCLRRG